MSGTGLLLTHPVNPAVLPWKDPSNIGVGAFDMDVEIVNGPTTVTGTAEGNELQANLIGETFSFAVESATLTLDFPSMGSAIEFKDTIVSFGVRMGESYAVGLAQQSAERIDTNETFTQNLPLVGGVLRLGETFYIGGTYGTETVERSVSNS